MVKQIYNAVRERYAFKIGLAVVLVGVVLLAVGYLTFTETRASVESDAETTLTGVAQQEAIDADEFIRDIKSQTLRISSSTGIITGNERTIWSKLETENRYLPEEVHSVKYLNLETQTVEADSNELDDQQFSVGDRPWVLELGDIGDPAEVQTFGPYEAEGESRIAFVTGMEGQPTHAIVTVVSLETRSEQIAGPTGNTVIQVVSQDSQQVVLGSNPDLVQQQSSLVSELSGSGGAMGSGQIQTISTDNDEIDGGQAVVATASLEEEPWTIVVAQPQSTVFKTVDEVRQNVILLIVIAFVGLVAVGAVIARDANAALSTMTEYAEEIEDGNLDVTIEQSRTDEFGKLAGLFARIRDSLRSRIEEAEDAQKDAEKARKEAEVARKEAETLAEDLQEKAQEYSDIMQQVGEGDLTKRMEPDGMNESMDQIATEFNEMIGEIEKTTGQLQDYVDEVEQAGAEVEQSAKTITKASEQVAESIQRISDSAYEQKEQFDKTADTLETVTEEFETIAARQGVDIDEQVEEIRQLAAEIEELGELNQQAMEDSEEVAGAAEEQAAELNEVSQRADDLQRYAEPLRDILEGFETENRHEFVFAVGPSSKNDEE